MSDYLDTDAIHRRLHKIEGQVKAIDRMVGDGAPCEDILVQVNAAKAALHRTAQMILESHLSKCVYEGAKAGSTPDEVAASFETAVKRFSNI